MILLYEARLPCPLENMAWHGMALRLSARNCPSLIEADLTAEKNAICFIHAKEPS